MSKSLHLRVKQIYEPPSNQDGLRILVDRLWPRGLKKETCRLDSWLKDIAPSNTLRRWFGHDPARWDEFQQRYFEELDERPDIWQAVMELARGKTVTLLYAAHDSQHNNAVALKNYLQRVR
ncbi:MAG: DUF488 domain-containing protein [Candidatus Hydrogenedentes bacterium]|nr:DUF488 domain-containing protein [Candidatus Hydrogenedentota bacterium]